MIPTFPALCDVDARCRVCNGVCDDREGDWIELSRDVAAASDLDRPGQRNLAKLMANGIPEETIAAVVLTTCSPLSPYLVGRIHQFIESGFYEYGLEKRLEATLATFIHRPTEQEKNEHALAVALSDATKLTQADRNSVVMDIEVGDYKSAIYDIVLNARSKLPQSLQTRVCEALSHGWFGDDAPSMYEALDCPGNRNVEQTTTAAD